MKAWDRRLAVWLLVGTVAAAGSSAAAAASAARRSTGHRPAHPQRTQPGELGILPATLSFFNRLVEKAIAVGPPTSTPTGPGTTPTPQGGGSDNGAGIDPNGL